MQARNVMTSTDIARLVEFTEAAAYADMLRATPKPWSCIEERTPAGWFLLTPKIDTLLFNRVLCCGLDQPVTRTDISSWLERYKAAGVHSYGVQVSPALQPASATQLLVQEGLRRHDSWTKVYRAAEPVVETAGVLRVERAGPAQAAIAARIACVAFGMPLHVSSWLEALVDRPGWRHYLAWDEDDPVGTAALFVHHDIGWLGIAGTYLARQARCADRAHGTPPHRRSRGGLPLVRDRDRRRPAGTPELLVPQHGSRRVPDCLQAAELHAGAWLIP